MVASWYSIHLVEIWESGGIAEQPLDRGVEKGQSVVVAWSRDRVIILLHAGVTTRPLLSPLLNYTFGVLPEIIEDVQFYCTNWYVVAFGQLIFLL
jgi:hypothetical protein